MPLLTGGSFSAEISVRFYPEDYVFSISRNMFSGSKFPKNILFNLENRSTAVDTHFWVRCSVADLAEILLRSP